MFVHISENNVGTRPLGTLRALAVGFDRAAARPILILPSVVLDLFLWLGPHLIIPSVFQLIDAGLTPPAGVEPAVGEQLILFKESFVELSSRYNLFTALSTLPAGLPFNLVFGLVASMSVGLPSLVALKLPMANPLGAPAHVPITGDGPTLWVWAALSLLGMVLGTVYLREIARGHAPEVREIPFGRTFMRLVLLVVLGYVLSGVLLFGSALLGSVDALLYVGMPVLFVGAVYLCFTTQGVVRYGFGVRAAMRESLRIVRWNFLSSMGFLMSAFLIAWLGATQVWSLPDEESWYMLLAIAGHAFVSTVVLSASFAYYQSRRAWMLGWTQKQFNEQQRTDGERDDTEGFQPIRSRQRGEAVTER